tara:strand:+ start:2394 stop:3200 length:807 start_codon:yes stop_codon:yes gene_type:complete
MAEYQKFIFSDNYSKEPENLARLQQKKETEAREMMAAELDAAKKQAFEEGFQEGQKMALEKLKSEMDLHMNAILENISKINEYKPQLQAMYEEHATASVRHIAKNMFFKSEELFSNEMLDQAVDNALNNLPFVSKITLKVPRNCKVYLEDTQVEEKIRQRGITDFLIFEDPTLNPGECKIEWDQSGLLSSKVESFEKINTTFAAFLSPEDLELSDNTNTLAKVEQTTPEQADVAVKQTAEEEVAEQTTEETVENAEQAPTQTEEIKQD